MFAAHNLAFHRKPGCIPQPGAAIFDESFASAGLQGMDPETPIDLLLSTLESQRTGGVTGEDRDRLVLMRERAQGALREKQDAGPLLREAGSREGMTVGNLKQWKALEWKTKPEVTITAATGRDAALEAFRKAAEGGFTPLLPMLAKAYLELFEKELDVSPTAELVRGVALGKGRGTRRGPLHVAVRLRRLDRRPPEAAHRCDQQARGAAVVVPGPRNAGHRGGGPAPLGAADRRPGLRARVLHQGREQRPAPRRRRGDRVGAVRRQGRRHRAKRCSICSARASRRCSRGRCRTGWPLPTTAR